MPSPTRGQFFYRCRMCGLLHGGATTANYLVLNPVLVAAVTEKPLHVDVGVATPPLTLIHSCGRWRTGVSDLIGYKLNSDYDASEDAAAT